MSYIGDIFMKELFLNYPWKNTHIRIKNKRFLIPEFLELAVEYKDAVTLAEHLGCNRNTIASAIKRDIPEFADKGKDTLCQYILRKFNFQRCSVCTDIKPPEGFYSTTVCKECSKTSARKTYADNRVYYREQQGNYYQHFKDSGQLKARSARNRAAKLQRTPAWADFEKIKEIYKNCPEGHHVDHIMPLQGELVSGLHVAENLQHLAAEDNLKKSNKYDIE
jgi:hypothetical protein